MIYEVKGSQDLASPTQALLAAVRQELADVGAEILEDAEERIQFSVPWVMWMPWRPGYWWSAASGGIVTVEASRKGTSVAYMLSIRRVRILALASSLIVIAMFAASGVSLLTIALWVLCIWLVVYGLWFGILHVAMDMLLDRARRQAVATRSEPPA